MWVIEQLHTAPDDRRGPTGQRVDLDERALERLEDGEKVKIRRWHGGDLLLRGDVVVSVPSESDDAQDESDER